MKRFFIILFFCPGLNAQDSVYVLQPVEIIVERPINKFQSFAILEKREIQNSSTVISLEGTLSKVPGLIISDRNNPSLGDRISIRGIGSRSSFGIRGIKILVDNIPLTLPDGQSQTNNIDFFSTGSIEILKGPASSFYGNASGGVINFRTELTQKENINVIPEVIFGSYELQKYSLKLSGQYNSHSYLLSFNNLNHRGFREHSSRRTYQLNTLYKNSLSDKISFSAVINYFNSPYLLNPGSLTGETVELDRNSVREFNKLQGTGEKADQFQSGITFNFLQDDLKLETTLYFVKRDLINPIPGRIIDLNRTVFGLRSFLNKKIFINTFEFDLSGGVDIEFQNDLRKEFENNGLPHTNFKPDEIFKNLNYGNKLIDQEENVLGAGPFLSFKFLLNKNLGFLSGIRYDYYLFKVSSPYTGSSTLRKMDQVSPSAGIFLQPALSSKIFLNYSTSFQTPTTSELSNRPDDAGGFNPELNPEKIYQIELGSEFFLSELNTSLSASVYFLNFTGLIIPYQVSTSEEVFFRNAGKAENKGAEVMIESNISEALKVTMSYSLMNFIFKDYLVEFNDSIYQLETNKIPGVPQQSFYFKINYENKKGAEWEIKFHFVDEYFTNDFNGQLPGNSSSTANFINKSNLKTDLRLGYNFSFDFFNALLFMGINNLFDKKYNGSVVPNALGERYFEPAPGRNWYAGLRINY